MAFNTKSSEEIIKEAFGGMTAEEIKEQLKQLEGLKTSIEEVKNLASGQSGVLSEIKESIGKMSTPYSRPDNQNQNQNDNNNQTKELRAWDVDAEGAFLDRSQPIVNALLDTKALVAKREAIDQINAANPDIPWQKLSKEIEEKVKGSSLQQMANPKFWENAYYICVGEKRQEIERDKQAKSGRFFTESASSSIVVNEEERKKPEDMLTESQLLAAKKSGLSPADFAKELNSMQRWN